MQSSEALAAPTSQPASPGPVTATRSNLAQALQTFLQCDLHEGETYAGLVIEQGRPVHHLILLPGDVSMNWGDAMRWATAAGGDLPTRAEQRLLMANAKEQFQSDWYWSNTQHAADADYAWGQNFGNGYQSYGYKSFEGRARAVRRLPI